jgi:hypothetical protein
LQDELHKYLGLMQALHATYADRNNALVSVQTLSTDVAALNKQIEKSVAASSKVFGGSKSQDRRTGELKETLTITEEAYQQGHKQYDLIKVCTYQIPCFHIRRVKLVDSCLLVFTCRIATNPS